MILAAGEGRRLRPFTEKVPKALMPVMGAPVIQYVIDWLVECGCAKAIVNVHHLADELESGLKELDWQGLPYEVSDERGLLLGPVGGVRHALDLLGEGPFVLVNADRLLSFDLRDVLASHETEMTFVINEAGDSGHAYPEMELDRDTRRVRALGDAAKNRPFYWGTLVANATAYENVKKGELTLFNREFLDPKFKAGEIGYHLAGGDWLDIDSPLLWAEAHFRLMKWIEEGRAIPERWKKRVEKSSKRFAPEIWGCDSLDLKKVQAPAFVGVSGGVTLGPRVVAYSDLGRNLKSEVAAAGASARI